MITLAAYNIKGGVGKTAAAVNLACASALSGRRTLIWDLDPQGAATFYFRVLPGIKGGRKRIIRMRKMADQILGTDLDLLDLIPADFSLRHLDLSLDCLKKPRKHLTRLLRAFQTDYDIVIVDCAPNMSLVSESVFKAARALLVPVIPTTLSIRGLQQLAGQLAKIARNPPRVLPFFSMVDRRKKLHRRICLAPESPFAFLNTQVPYSSQIEQMGIYRQPVQLFAPGSKAARAYGLLWREIEGSLTVGPQAENSMEIY